MYLGIGVHTLGMLGWILEQIDGPADVAVTTFSTSEEFLSGFLNLRKKNFISHATMVADLKASKKTVKLKDLMGMCFENSSCSWGPHVHQRSVLTKQYLWRPC